MPTDEVPPAERESAPPTPPSKRGGSLTQQALRMGLAWAAQQSLGTLALVALGGGAMGLSQVAGAFLFGEFYPIGPPLGFGVAGVGLWLVLRPVPEGAREAILHGSVPDDPAWRTWEVGLAAGGIGGVLLGATISALLSW